jgi:hypothetical protein
MSIPTAAEVEALRVAWLKVAGIYSTNNTHDQRLWADTGIAYSAYSAARNARKEATT